ALFQVADERMIFEREGEHGVEWELQRSCEVFAQIIVDSVSMTVRLGPSGKNLSRIENVFRIEDSLDLAHYSEQLISELLLHVFGAHDPDTVLGGKRAFELPHQRRSLICDLPKFFKIVCTMQVEHWAHV